MVSSETENFIVSATASMGNGHFLGCCESRSSQWTVPTTSLHKSNPLGSCSCPWPMVAQGFPSAMAAGRMLHCFIAITLDDLEGAAECATLGGGCFSAWNQMLKATLNNP